jgi:hypothetical protein
VITLLLAACAVLPSAVEAPPLEVLHQFAIKARGQTFAGMAAVQIQGDAYTLVAITPGGLELFHVRGDAETHMVAAPQEDMQAVLERLPLGRDLHLLYAWSCGSAPACEIGGGSLTEAATDAGFTRTWKGPGGPAVVIVEEGRATLEDTRRGYTLVVVGEELRVPHP